MGEARHRIAEGPEEQECLGVFERWSSPRMT